MVDAGGGKTAKLKLLWVVEHSKHELRELARLRLVALLFDEKAYDEALKQLNGKVSPTFAARFAESRGDVLIAQGKRAEAATVYQAALSDLESADKAGAESGAANGLQAQSNVIYRDLLQQKRSTPWAGASNEEGPCRRFAVPRRGALSVGLLDARVNESVCQQRPQMAELQPITATTEEARSIWNESIGKADGYVFSPAVVGSTVRHFARTAA